MKIKQFKYSSDNLAYLVYSEKTAVAIDAGAVSDMALFAEENSLEIKYITNTHNHYDHTSGNFAMTERTGAEFIDCRELIDKPAIEVDGEKLEVYHTPGHMDDCVTFHADNFLITGDTLFNGAIGNCFSGDMKSFFNSISFLISFPPETVIYAGHDYQREAIAFAKTIDKKNPDFESYLQKRDPHHVFSTIEEELKVNPFVRYNDEEMIEILKANNLPAGSEYERWNSVFELY